MLWLAASSVRADRLDVKAKYEEDLIATAILRHHLRPEPSPEGKRIEAVIVEANPIILPGDFPLSSKIPWTWLNVIHVRTRDDVIARELLFQPGQIYQRDIIEESGRNLRAYLFVSVARIVAVKGSRDDLVKILVVTKDQWSLRLNTNFELDGDRLDSLSFSFSENNLAGRNKAVAVNFALDPGRYTAGLGYTDPRIWGSRHALAVSANMFLNRETGAPEGTYVNLAVGRPLFSLRTEWGWQASVIYDLEKTRSFCGGTLNEFTFTAGVLSPPCQPGKVGPTTDVIPDIYGQSLLTGALQGTRSWGVLNKINLTVGLMAHSYQYGLTSDFPTNISAAGRAAYLASYVPRSERADGPFVQFQAYRASYVRLKNIDTFALTEDYRLGPEIILTVRDASHYLGLDLDYVELVGAYDQTFLFGDDLLIYSAGLQTRIEENAYPGSNQVNQEIDFNFRNVSPVLGFLRLHVEGQLSLRGHDIANVRYTLGSDSGLRGYPPRYFQGNNSYQLNVEVRTLALNLWTLHLGAVAFYDGGDTPANILQGQWHQDAGVGLRLLIPQFNRSVLRADLAEPFESVPGSGYLPRFSASFGQAF